MDTRAPRIADGFVHRVISSLPSAAALPAYLYEYSQRPGLLDLAPVLACAIAVAFGFAVPMILTRGFNKPIPSSRHLALFSPRLQRSLLVTVAVLLTLPPFFRLGIRMVSA